VHDVLDSIDAATFAGGIDVVKITSSTGVGVIGKEDMAAKVGVMDDSTGVPNSASPVSKISF
jgi:hypothetical protein